MQEPHYLCYFKQKPWPTLVKNGQITAESSTSSLIYWEQQQYQYAKNNKQQQKSSTSSLIYWEQQQHQYAENNKQSKEHLQP